MTQWVAFAAIVTLLTAAMVGLSLLTQRSITPIGTDGVTEAPPPESDGTAGVRSGAFDSDELHPGEDETTARGATERAGDTSASVDREFELADEAIVASDAPGTDDAESETTSATESGARPASERRSPQLAGDVVGYVGGEPVTSRGLLVNVTITQGLFLAIVIGAVVLTGVPVDALGLAVSWQDLVVGLGAGLGLYGASEVGGALVRRVGIDHDEWLRESLAPSGLLGWVGLFVVVLPLIAVFEELLFRGVLIGALETGFGVSPWLLAVGSSLLFAVGHGIQGRAGVVVTGVVGFVLAGLFVVTGSLLVVVTAHYVLNACEFVVHEGVGTSSTARTR